MKAELHDYQKQALDFCMQRLFVDDELGAGLFLDPGLGKTLITLALLEFLRDMGEIDSALVIAPLRVCRLVWGQEIKKWGFDFTTNLLCGRVAPVMSKRLGRTIPGPALREKRAFIDLINPESVHHLLEHGDRWDMVVVDESTKFKNWSAKRMKAFRKLLKNFLKRLILTGTPAPNSLADLHSQVYILDGGVALGRNVTVFRSLYMQQGGWQGRQWMLRDGQEQKIHTAVAPLCLRLDAETCLDMPELVVNDIECELPSRCIRQYKVLKKQLLAELASGSILAQNAASAYMKMRQFANGRMFDENRNVHFVHDAKLDMFVDLVDELGGKSVLCFYQFWHDLGALLKKFPKASVMNGQTKKTDEKTIDDWNAGKIHVLLAQNQSISHGLNMQGCSADMIYYGMNDQLEVYDQSFRRRYRQGVKGKQVRIHRLLTKGTVDKTIRDRIMGKFKTQREFLDGLKKHARS